MKIEMGTYVTGPLTEKEFDGVKAAFIRAGARDMASTIYSRYLEHTNILFDDDGTVWVCISQNAERVHPYRFLYKATVSEILNKTEKFEEGDSSRTLADSLYKEFLAAGWSKEDIKELHPKTVKSHLSDTTTEKVDFNKVCQMVKEINESLCETSNAENKNQEIPETKTEEESDMKLTTLTLQVPTKPLHLLKPITLIYGKCVKGFDEEGLYALLGRIEKDQEVLKKLGTGNASERVKRQISDLSDARSHVIKAIDELPDDEYEEEAK
tara:strand:- start:22630 stop:23433 length:804 start_codon:yes stop_codon:yes gene_type:complete